jgi:hypothetical protein
MGFSLSLSPSTGLATAAKSPAKPLAAFAVLPVGALQASLTS